MLRICISVRRLCQKTGSDRKPPIMFLNVAEKNDAAKTIANLLSRGSSQRREGLSPYNKIYEFQHDVLQHSNAKMVMTSVSGHLLQNAFDSQYKNWKQVDPIKLFEAPIRKYCPDDYQKIQKTLQREVRGAKGLIIWTDCDREGENIGFEIIDVCRAVKPNIPVYRAKFSEITTASVKRALANLIEPDALQSAAVDVRTELDLRIGAAFTRFQTLRFQRIFPVINNHLVSYGSCQIPTLGFVAKRYKEVESFQPQSFWKLRLTHTIDALTVEYNWARNRLFDQQCCAAIFDLCRVEQPLEATVTNVTNKSKSKWRPVALDTIELEKLGSRKLKMSAKQTMTIAEKLYTRGLISYPRTETNSFSKEIDLRPLVEMQVPHPNWGEFASKILQWGVNPRNGTKSDQAHPPIHPTKLATNLDADEHKVYELVVRHFLACVSKDATGAETIVNAVLADEEFTATGLCIHERNYLEVYVYERWSAKEIHLYEIGQTFEPTSFTMVDGKTTAPALLTEAELIAMMDKHGIGTDATHAEHINTVIEREYIGKIDDKFLVPGKLGMGLVEGYEAIKLPLAEPELRAGLEKDLQLICNGTRQPDQVLREQVNIYREAFKVITAKANQMDQQMAIRLDSQPVAAPEPEPYQEIVEACKCPKCHQMMALKYINNAYCLSCLNYPACRNSIWFPSTIIKEAMVTANACSKCGENYKRVKYTFRSYRHTSVLDQRQLSADGLTYESCLFCDTNLQELCEVNRTALGAMNTNIPHQRAPAVSTNRSNFSTTSSMPAPPNRPPTNQSRNAVAPPPQRDRPTNNTNNNRFNNSNASNQLSNPSLTSRPSNNPTTPHRPTGNTPLPEVKCPKCNSVARIFTVKKEGPNIGRQFYNCTTQCNFFQWADATAAPTSRTSYGGGASASNATGAAGNDGASRGKRKCSNCRQEGHTIKKCPRLQNSLM